MPVYAKDAFGRRVVKGKPQSVNVQVFADGRLVHAEDLDPDLWPFQTNNISEWYKRAIYQLKTKQWVQVHRTLWDIEMDGEFVINDGKKLVEGRGRSETKFSITIKPKRPCDDVEDYVRIDIHIRTKAYAQIWQEKQRLPDGGSFAKEPTKPEIRSDPLGGGSFVRSKSSKDK